jgi:hypothetical protein
VVLLSGKDDLMDAAEVKDMLDVAGHVKVGRIGDSSAAAASSDSCAANSLKYAMCKQRKWSLVDAAA